jgi:hypothetical protein
VSSCLCKFATISIYFKVFLLSSPTAKYSLSPPDHVLLQRQTARRYLCSYVTLHIPIDTARRSCAAISYSPSQPLSPLYKTESGARLQSSQDSDPSLVDWCPHSLVYIHRLCGRLDQSILIREHTTPARICLDAFVDTAERNYSLDILKGNMI